MAIDVNPASLAGPRIDRLRDGSVRQYNPFTGLTVLSVPARARRPRPVDDIVAEASRPVRDSAGREAVCDFCDGCHERTTPEKSRVEEATETPGGFRTIERPDPAHALDTPAAVRRLANLFEIVSYDFWVNEHGLQPDDEALAHQARYLDDPRGIAHVRALLEYAEPDTAWHDASRTTLERASLRFFAGSHELVVARRHFTTTQDEPAAPAELASSGSLSPDEHFVYVRCALDAAAAIEHTNPHARSVHVFQNWRRDAGASFDHLHKQIIALDVVGDPLERKLAILRDRPDAFVAWGIEFARSENLVIAEQGSTLAYVEPGHRFPTVTIVSASEAVRPEDMAPDELRDLSDVLRHVHRAIGPSVPVNEEWQIVPQGADVLMPIHVHVRLRDHRIAGLEGAAGVYVSSHSPAELRTRLAAPRFA